MTDNQLPKLPNLSGSDKEPEPKKPASLPPVKPSLPPMNNESEKTSNAPQLPKTLPPPAPKKERKEEMHLGPDDEKEKPMSLMDAIAAKQSKEKAEGKLDEKAPEDEKAYIDGVPVEEVPLTQPQKTKTFLFGGLAAAVAVVAISLGSSVLTDEMVEEVPNQTGTASGNVNSAQNAWYEREGEDLTPSTVPDWSKDEKTIDASTITSEEIAYFTKTIADTQVLALISTNLPSSEEGFVTDYSKALDNDGFPNPMFTPLSEELFITHSGIMLEKLLNPLYGGWGEAQFSDNKASTNFPRSALDGVFSQKYEEKYFDAKDYSYLPVYADWEANNYNNDKLIPVGGARWFGFVQEGTAEFKYSQKTTGYVIDAVYDVQFKALTTSRNVTTRTGVLKVQYVSNPAAENDEKALRILINAAELKLN